MFIYCSMLVILHFVVAFLNLLLADSLYKCGFAFISWWMSVLFVHHSFSQSGIRCLQSFCVRNTALSPRDSVVNTAGWRGRSWWGLQFIKSFILPRRISRDIVYLCVSAFWFKRCSPFLEIKGSKVAWTPLFLFSVKWGKILFKWVYYWYNIFILWIL